MRTLSFLFLLSFALCTGALEAQTTAADSIGAVLPLRQAVDIAIRNNLVVNQADITSQTYKVAFDQSWEYMLPTLGANFSQGLSFGRSLNTTINQYVTARTGTGNYNLNAGLTIFSGLQLQNGVKAARYNFEASRLDLRYQKDNITLSVLLAYLQVLSAHDQLAATRQQESTDTANLHRLEVQAKEGAVLVLSTLTDVQGQVAQDEINIATSINTLESNKISLFQLMNVPFKRDVEYENSVNTANIADYQTAPDSLYASALNVVPNVQSSSLKMLGYEKALSAARGAYFPTLSFQGNVNSNYSSALTTQGTNNKIPWGTQFHDNRSEYIGLYLTVPILNGFRVRNNVRTAKINLAGAKLIETTTRLALQQAVELAFQNMIAAYKSYKFYNDQAAAFAESFRITNIRFNEGVVTSDVYIQAKGRSDAATINAAYARYAYIFRTKVLDYYQGRLSIP